MFLPNSFVCACVLGCHHATMLFLTRAEEKKLAFELHPDLSRDGIYMGSFPLCQVLLINDSNYPWFVLVPQREEIRDTIDLSKTDYEALWAESRAFSFAIMKLFAGEKLNVAALGNVTPQLHLHHVVRSAADVAWPGPIWGVQPLQPYDEQARFGVCSRCCPMKRSKSKKLEVDCPRLKSPALPADDLIET